jgi:hypothetical protein
MSGAIDPAALNGIFSGSPPPARSVFAITSGDRGIMTDRHSLDDQQSAHARPGMRLDQGLGQVYKRLPVGNSESGPEVIVWCYRQEGSARLEGWWN